MKLITKALLRQIPPLYSQENEQDPRVYCKFFMPDGSWTWYVTEGSALCKSCHLPDDKDAHRPLTEYEPDFDDILFFGYVVGPFPELGYFALSELLAFRGALGLPVERDLYFDPCRLSDIRKR